MTAAVLTVGPDQPLEDSMALMIERDIRHLPVMENDRSAPRLKARRGRSP